MIQFEINKNIILTIKFMLDSFKFKFGGITINTTKGLVQGSTLSPILFNIYFNDLLSQFENKKVLSFAFADDIACWWNNLEEVKRATSIIKRWCIENGMQINPNKSGIMRILKRSGKWNFINNDLDIPEVKNKKYLLFSINQSMKIKDHTDKVRVIENTIGRKSKLLGKLMKTIKGKRVVFETLLKSRLSYAAQEISNILPDNKDKWNSMLYRVLKAILGINHNIKKEDLLNTMSVNTKDKDKDKKFFINLLSTNALKLKLRCLFHKYSKKKIWDCEQINDNNHWITVCKISSQWRKKWETIWHAVLGKNFIEMLNKSYMLKSNQKKVALIINKAVEELIDIYLGKGEVSRILLFWN